MKKSFLAVLASTVVVSALVSQCSIAEETSMTRTECTVARVAERHIAVRYPEFDSIKNPPIVQNKGGTWEVYYELPKEVLGGTPVVVIEKATLKVLRSFHTQ
jgi:NTF2 fold immunity protein